MKKYFAFIGLVVILAFPAYANSVQNSSFAQTPVLFINAGQGGGIYTTNIICERAGLEYDWVEGDPTVEHLSTGVGLSTYDPKRDLPVYYTKCSSFPNGTPYRTIVLVLTTPVMSTYWDLYRNESVRLNKTIEWAKNNGIKVIGMHVEGAEMRGRSAFYIEDIIDLIAPQCEMLVVVANGDQDGKFSYIAEANNIPIEIAPNIQGLVPVIQSIFGL